MRLLPLAITLLVGSSGLTTSLSNDHAGARPMALKLKFTSQLQCGRPIGPPLVVTLPAAVRLPSKVSPDAVLIGGSAAESVSVSRHVVVIKVARPEVICDVVGPGPVSIVFTRSARLGNPAKPGRYRLSVRRGTQNVTGTFVVRR